MLGVVAIGVHIFQEGILEAASLGTSIPAMCV